MTELFQVREGRKNGALFILQNVFVWRSSAQRKGKPKLVRWSGNNFNATTRWTLNPMGFGKIRLLPSPRPEGRGQRVYDAARVAAQDVFALIARPLEIIGFRSQFPAAGRAPQALEDVAEAQERQHDERRLLAHR
eukprot:CAMPEP_0119290228 /NCGR_PEP_ID=MMETSP1329-20130426/40404_1 /TAXON_ID=114041 /ORGANISM="Genus nov. species nov., Strain RCC1024" /LENGTH=134 /DNA_ID=CAMNT_0007291043 /DNA_START=388 /DNA_END=792 /DNA_ORIENTATION=-